nr:MAG TPA: hypothetical protein [Caudoviricetes sp.]
MNSPSRSGLSFYRGKYGEKESGRRRCHHWRFDSVRVLGVLKRENLNGAEV